MQDLISLSPIMNLMKTLFYYHATMATDLRTQPLWLYRTTYQLLKPIDPYKCTPYSYNESTAANKHRKAPNG